MSMPMIDIHSESIADAASLANWDKPSGDVTNAQFQAALADSLVADDPDAVRPLADFSVDSAADERAAEEWPNGFDEQGPEVAESEEPLSEDGLSAIPPGGDDELLADIGIQNQQAETRELTPAELSAGIEQLGVAAEQLGLNDSPAAQQLAYDLTAPFSAAPNSIDAQQLGSTMSKAVLSALQIHEAQGSNPNLGPVPAQAAQAFTSDFLSACGLDPRMTEVDSQRFASTVLVGTLNFLDAVSKYGPEAGLSMLNSPIAAEAFANELNACFGINAQVDRQTALHIADSGGRYILSLLKKLPQALERQEHRASRGVRRMSSRFRTNADLFDDEGESLYRAQKGRL